MQLLKKALEPQQRQTQQEIMGNALDTLLLFCGLALLLALVVLAMIESQARDRRNDHELITVLIQFDSRWQLIPKGMRFRNLPFFGKCLQYYSANAVARPLATLQTDLGTTWVFRANERREIRVTFVSTLYTSIGELVVFRNVRRTRSSVAGTSVKTLGAESTDWVVEGEQVPILVVTLLNHAFPVIESTKQITRIELCERYISMSGPQVLEMTEIADFIAEAQCVCDCFINALLAAKQGGQTRLP
jgi:hypothetical protein